jgi:hypothetical protein
MGYKKAHHTTFVILIDQSGNFLTDKIFFIQQRFAFVRIQINYMLAITLSQQENNILSNLSGGISRCRNTNGNLVLC